MSTIRRQRKRYADTARCGSVGGRATRQGGTLARRQLDTHALTYELVRTYVATFAWVERGFVARADDYLLQPHSRCADALPRRGVCTLPLALHRVSTPAQSPRLSSLPLLLAGSLCFSPQAPPLHHSHQCAGVCPRTYVYRTGWLCKARFTVSTVHPFDRSSGSFLLPPYNP